MNIKKIDQALGVLPLLDGAEKRIPQMRTRIILVAGFGSVNERSSSKGCSQKVFQEELSCFIKHAEALRAIINTMHKPVLECFNKKDADIPHVFYLEHDLLQYVVAATKAKDSGGVLPPKGKKGRPEALRARQLTNELGRIYTELTGRKAARNVKGGDQETGRFLRFSEDIFLALGIKNSAKSQVSIRSKRMYKKYPKKTH